MKIGLYNIFTTIWFFLMLGSGGFLSYISFEKGLFTGDLIFVAKFFMGLLTIVTIGVGGFFIFKFRFLLIKGKRIYSLYPFIFRYKSLDLDKISKITWTSWQIKATVYKTIKIIDIDKRMISFNDFEFENFDQLIREIPNSQTDIRKSKIDYEQAKSNISFMSFMILVNILLIVVVAYFSITRDGLKMIHVGFSILTSLLIYAAQTRRIRYKQIIKNGT